MEITNENRARDAQHLKIRLKYVEIERNIT